MPRIAADQHLCAIVLQVSFAACISAKGRLAELRIAPVHLSAKTATLQRMRRLVLAGARYDACCTVTLCRQDGKGSTPMTRFRPKYITFDCYGTLTNFDMAGAAQRVYGPRLSPAAMAQ